MFPHRIKYNFIVIHNVTRVAVWDQQQVSLSPASYPFILPSAGECCFVGHFCPLSPSIESFALRRVLVRVCFEVKRALVLFENKYYVGVQRGPFGGHVGLVGHLVEPEARLEEVNLERG